MYIHSVFFLKGANFFVFISMFVNLYNIFITLFKNPENSYFLKLYTTNNINQNLYFYLLSQILILHKKF